MKISRSRLFLAVACLSLAAVPVLSQVTPPDLSVCDGVTCDNLPSSVCSAAGFKITLTGFTEPSTNNNGSATYTYQICSPAAGVCNGAVRNGESCLDNSFCQKKGQAEDLTATCSRECATDSFRGLSHFDVAFPELGASCLSATTLVTGSCTNGNFVLGDGSCFGATSPVAKCDNTNLATGSCFTMTVTFAGELTGLGSGPMAVVDKEATTCTASCMAGPSCNRCNPPPPGQECLTRTIGFWGNHPWITNNYVPVTVCGKSLGCSGGISTTSSPACLAGTCDSVIEGLCSVPGSELKSNTAYVSMVRQMTAAQLNLNATASHFIGATCSAFTYGGKNIQQWIADCESLCGADEATISASGCIEALDAFNNSEDTGFDVTPSPFDRPPVDDFGKISGADSKQCGKAQGNGKDPKLVIGMKVGSNDCR
ncbi:MAG TPA: hypothetical protein VJ725_16250 [Thermoanaerobaculia bacterium]|nr:hypothetical protein [Thermoanaerobaculia bacterium]